MPAPGAGLAQQPGGRGVLVCLCVKNNMLRAEIADRRSESLGAPELVQLFACRQHSIAFSELRLASRRLQC